MLNPRIACYLQLLYTFDICWQASMMGVAAEKTVATSESIEMSDNANMMKCLRMQKKEHKKLLPLG